MNERELCSAIELEYHKVFLQNLCFLMLNKNRVERKKVLTTKNVLAYADVFRLVFLETRSCAVVSACAEFIRSFTAELCGLN
jgi:hypothetical protein